MRFSKSRTDDTPLLINEHETTMSSISSPPRESHSSIQCRTLQDDHMSCSIDKPSPSAEYIYTKIVKAIGTNEFIEEKRLLKRASWSPTFLQEHGLPPTGKRTENEQLTSHRNLNRVRMRPKVSRYFQPQQPQQQQKQTYDHRISSGRPVSFNERYDRHLIERKLSNLPLVSTQNNTIELNPKNHSYNLLRISVVDFMHIIFESFISLYKNEVLLKKILFLFLMVTIIY